MRFHRSRVRMNGVLARVLTHRRRLAVAAGVVTVAVAASVTAVVVTRGGQPQRDVATAFVLPSLVATPPTAPAGGTPEPSSEPTSVASAVAAAADVEPLPVVAAIAELRNSSAPPAMDIDRQAHIRSVSAQPGAALAAPEGTPAGAEAVTVASAFVNRYGQGFGLLPGQHAAVARVDDVPGGDRVVRFQQQIGGVPVVGGDLVVAVDEAGGVVSASAEAPAAAPTTVTAQVTADQAAAVALATAADRTGLTADRLRVTRSRLWYFDPRVVGVPGRPELRLTWWVTVGSAELDTDVQSVFVDAVDGGAVFTHSEVRFAKNRLVCDLAEAEDLPIEFDPTTYVCSDAAGGPPVRRREGQVPYSVTAVNTAYDLLGAVYDFYQTNFGRDSIDGHGSPLAATVRACHLTCPYDNAFWDGEQMVFGPGWEAADDVVGHELTHGVTQHTSDLYYFAESGAINEALSDIFGEFVDQSRGSDNDDAWLIGESSPIGAFRSMSNPPAFDGDGDSIPDPDEVGDLGYTLGLLNSGDNYGVHTLSGVVNKAAHLLAVGGVKNGFTVDAIGREKSAQIWYRLQYLLPSGAEMADLVALLPAACRSLVGLMPPGTATPITTADCVEAGEATLATRMNFPSGTTDANNCATPGMPSQTLYYEDFERGHGGWDLGTGWQGLPNPDWPFSFANSGKLALEAFLPFASSASTAWLGRSLTAPADVTQLRLSWAEVVYDNGGTLIIQGEGAPHTYPGGDLFSYGYAKRTVSLAGALAPGETFTIGARPVAAAGTWWNVDDVRVYQCLPAVTGAPAYVAADLTVGATEVTAAVTWGAPVYVAPGNPVASYEVSYQSLPDGASGAVVVPATESSVVLTGLTPDRRYRIVVRAVGGDGSFGQGVGAYVPGDPVFDCSVLDPTGRLERLGCSMMPQSP